jgi:hypothetical protein
VRLKYLKILPENAVIVAKANEKGQENVNNQKG